MSTLLQQVLTERPSANPNNWNAASLGGLQDINGNQIFYTWVDSQSGRPWSLHQKIDVSGSMEKGFDGDPRFITDDQVEQGGYQIKPGQEPLIIYRPGKTKTALDNLKTDRPNMPASVYQSRKSQIVKGIFYNGSQIASGPGFVPYVNDFKIHPTQQQREQIALLQKMASDNGIEIRHWGTRRFYDPENDVIVLPTRDHFPSPEAYMRTLAHEMVHATMHRNHPQNPHDPPRIPGLPSHARTGDRIYAAEEWRADAGSLRILEAIGVNVPHDEVRRSAAYLQSWTQYGEPDPHRPGQFITGNLTTAERQQAVERSLDAANYLLRSIDKHIDQTPQQTQELRRISQTYPAPGQPLATRFAAATLEQDGVMAQSVATPVASPPAPTAQSILANLYAARGQQAPQGMLQLADMIGQAAPQWQPEQQANATAYLACKAQQEKVPAHGIEKLQVGEFRGTEYIHAVASDQFMNPASRSNRVAIASVEKAVQAPAAESLSQLQEMQQAQTQTQSHHQQASAPVMRMG